MENIKKSKSKHIPMFKLVGDSCIGCPFFELKSRRTSAYANCHAPDIERAVNNNIKSYNCKELKITGEYRSDTTIKVPRPKWCPLNIGDVIVTVRKDKYGIMQDIKYDLQKNTVEETWDSFNSTIKKLKLKK